MIHFGIPPDLWRPFCPFRTLREWEFPTVSEWLLLFARWKRYGMMPATGGLDAQAERTLQAFDVMSHALTMRRLGE